MASDLKNRIIFTVLILCVYRFGTYVPLPGIDPESLQSLMESKQRGLLGMFNIFSGGAVSRMAIFALGIMPYISSSIIIQLLTGVSETFKNLKNRGYLEITDKRMTRFNMTLNQSIEMVDWAFKNSIGGEIFVPKTFKAFKSASASS